MILLNYFFGENESMYVISDYNENGKNIVVTYIVCWCAKTGSSNNDSILLDLNKAVKMQFTTSKTTNIHHILDSNIIEVVYKTWNENKTETVILYIYILQIFYLITCSNSNASVYMITLILIGGPGWPNGLGCGLQNHKSTTMSSHSGTHFKS